MSSSEASSASSSPVLQTRRLPCATHPTLSIPKPARRPSTQLSPSISSIPEDALLEFEPELPISVDKLVDLNHDIKSKLTDLLNCDAVRNDAKTRLWVQARLMEAELELKRQRRRRVSTPSVVLTPMDETE